MKNKKNILLLVLALLLVNFTGCGKTEQKIEKNIKVTNVKLLNPKKADISLSVEFNGEVKANKDYYLSSKISEKIKKFYVDNGEKVKYSDRLIGFETLTYNARKNQALANYNSAVENFEMMEKELKRNKTLYQKKVINDKTMDSINNAYQKALSSKEVTEAAYELAKDEMSGTLLTAPFDGVFVDRNGELGQTVNKGFVLGRVLDISKVKVEFYLSQSNVQKIGINNECVIEGRKGRIVSINTSADNVSRNYLVKAEFDNSDEFFRPNSFVDGKIHIKTFKNVPLLMENSILYDKTGTKYVFVASKNSENIDVAVRKNINIIAQEGNDVYADNISIKDLVVVSGQSIIEDGERISKIEE